MSLESHKVDKRRLVDDTYPCIYSDSDREPFGYVYCIENVHTRRKYIGSTVDFDRRVSEYVRAYQVTETSYDRMIHRELRRLGIENFRMYKVEAAYDAKTLRERELYYIKEWNTKIISQIIS